MNRGLVWHVEVFDVNFTGFGAQCDNGKASGVVANSELTRGVITSDDLMQDLEVREAVDVHLAMNQRAHEVKATVLCSEEPPRLGLFES